MTKLQITKDLIIKINGSELSSAAQLTEAVESSAGKEITLTYKRDGKEYTAFINNGKNFLHPEATK